jgi:hypothetical protein
MKLLDWLPSARRDRGWDDVPGDPTVRRMDELATRALSPDEETLARMRANATAAFRDAAASREAARIRPIVRPAAPRRLRFAAAGMAVALLAISSVGVAAAESGPGQPFYRTRLAVEALFLPPAGTDARLDADLDRAQARLADATAAASRGDSNAEADAVGAYVEVVVSIQMPGDAAAVERLREWLGRQLAELQRLRGSAQGGVGQEVGRAIDSLDSLLRRAGGPPGSNPTGSPSAGTNPSAKPSNTGQGGQGGQGGQASPSAGGAVSPKPAGSGAAGSPQPAGSGQGGPTGTSKAGGTGQEGPGGH